MRAEHQPVLSLFHGIADLTARSICLRKKAEATFFNALTLRSGTARQDHRARGAIPAASHLFDDWQDGMSGDRVSYDADRVDIFRRVASYVDRVLRGEKPGDLPFQAPYELVINLTTAKVLGIEFPISLLMRADEVIE